MSQLRSWVKKRERLLVAYNLAVLLNAETAPFRESAAMQPSPTCRHEMKLSSPEPNSRTYAGSCRSAL